jgi:hypothetical protein
MTAVPAQIAMLSATTLDSKSVTVGYSIDSSIHDAPIPIGIYRSASPTFDSTAVPVAKTMIDATMIDVDGKAALNAGTHAITLRLANGLPPNPMHPYVLVVANPDTTGVSVPSETAAFRKQTIGVIVHGGVQPSSWKKAGPPWEAKMAKSLKAEGYDLVIAYNWVAESGHAGAAAKQGPRLARLIDQAASQIAPNIPVDLHIIGHSEGTVVASLALNDLKPPINLTQGYKELTFLDPHAAGNGFKGKQLSTSDSIEGVLAKAYISHYQASANDPAPVVQGNVNDAQVFYQHTPVAAAHTNKGLYNLWGQVPVPAASGVPVHYANLTGPGISHAGDFSVFDWYQKNIVPLLGNGPAFVNPSQLTASRTLSATNPQALPTISGIVTPGAKVELVGYAQNKQVSLGVTKADSTGHWSISEPTVIQGNYKIYARAQLPVADGLNKVFVQPMVRVAGLLVN